MSDQRDPDRDILLQAFIDSRNEKDRSIFLSAVGGIGFCTTMLFDKDLAANGTLVVFLAISLVLFSLACASVLVVFNANASLLQRLLRDPSNSNESPLIVALDWIAVISFVVAILSIGAAIITHLMCASN